MVNVYFKKYGKGDSHILTRQKKFPQWCLIINFDPYFIPMKIKIALLQAFVASCLLIACNDHTTQSAQVEQVATNEISRVDTATATATSDTVKWIDHFREFRDALYQQKKEKVKMFIGWPLISDGIWFLVGDESKTNVQTDEPIPFTEKDFDKFYSRLFFKEFINCLLKVKTEELFKNGEYQTPEIKVDATIYILYCTVNEAENTLSLNFSSVTKGVNENGEIDGSEGNVIYTFDILPDGMIRLKKPADGRIIKITLIKKPFRSNDLKGSFHL